MSQLPQSWDSIQLKDLFSFVLGGDWGKEPEYSDKDFKTVFCIRGTEFKRWSKEKGATSVERKVKNSSAEKRKLKSGDILIEISGGGPEQPVGRTVLIDDAALKHNPDYPKVCTNFIRLTRPKDSVDSRYLNYYLQNFYVSGEVVNYQGGSNNLRNLKFKEYETIKVPVAPFEEQKRIADKLDSVLAKVEAAQARLDKIPTILKRFRQSVLAAATSGELTKDWREENEIDENWEVYKLKELSNSIRSGSGKKPSGVENGTPILRSSAVRILDIDYSDFRTIEESLLTDRDLIQDGDLLFTRLSGSKEYVGNCAKVGNLSRKMAYPDRLFKVELNDIELADYIEVYCSSPSYFKYIEESIKSSAGHQRITTEVIKGIEIKLPSKNERDEILRVINLLFAKASKVERQYLNAKSKIDSLTQSILSKAFSGKL